MNKLGKYFWVGFFLLIFLIFLVTLRVTKPRILILSSYSQNNQISQYVKQGADASIAGNRMPVSVLTHYMSINTTSNSEQVIRRDNEALSFIKHFDPNVLIAVGFDANRLLAKRMEKLSPNRWIIPVAVDSELPDIGYQKNPNVIGVIRRMPYLGIEEFLSKTEQRQKVFVSIIGADTPSNQVRIHQLEQSHSNNIEIKGKLLSSCFKDWKQFIRQLPPKIDGLLILPTQQLQEECDSGMPLLSGDQFIPWIEANSTPLPIGLDGSFVKNGGAVSFYPSYEEEGELAITLALDILKSNDRAEIRPIHSESYQIALKKERLDKRGISIPNVYLQYGAKSGRNYRDSD
jgi:hypothetical protein